MRSSRQPLQPSTPSASSAPLAPLQVTGPTPLPLLNHRVHSNRPKRANTLPAVKDDGGAGATELGDATQFLTRSGAAKLLAVSPNTVTRWAQEGRLPSLLTLGGHHRFDREQLEQVRQVLYRAGGRAD